LWAREHYKALAMDEPIPTPRGWKQLGELDVGDLVFGPDGRPTRVVARTEVFTDPDCYEVVFDDDTTMRAGSDHLWTVERRTRKRIPGTHKIGAGKRQYRESVTLSTKELAAHDHRQDNRLAIPVNQPLVLPDSKLPIGPYTLGAWLGDGSQSTGVITGADAEVFAGIRAEGYSLGSNARIDRTEARTIYGIRPLLRQLQLTEGKHIPPAYQRASIAQRLELLRGLMDSDGHCNTRGTATFVNKCEALVDGVYELAAGLGLKPRKYAFTAAHGRFWHVAFQAYGALNPFKLQRKAERAKPGGRPSTRRYIVAVRKIDPIPMRCIQVARADGLYLAGRQMVTTHNSTLGTFGLSLQDILASHGEDPEPRYGGREVTIGFFSLTRPLAKDPLKQIKIAAETNEELKALFPDVLYANPKKESPKWSEDEGLVFKRTGNVRECTVEAWGLVDGMPTGKHFMICDFDDIVTERSVTPEMIPKTTAAWELAQNLGTEGGWFRYKGTRYALFDTYAEMMKRGIPARIYPCTTDGSEDFSKAVLRSPEFLAGKRKLQGPYTFGAQMLLNPQADTAQGFKEEWLRYWPASNFDGMNFYIVVDPASGKNASGTKKRSHDFTSMWVVGIAGDGNYYVVDGVRDRLNLSGRAKALFRLHRKWRPLNVGYEEYGLQADIEHMKSEQDRLNYRFTITELGGALPKVDRIKRLVPVFEQHRLYLPASGILVKNHEGQTVNIVRDFIEEEYKTFPVVSHDDGLDSLSRILDEELGVTPPEPDEEPRPSWMDELESGEKEEDDFVTR
jgi:phage terminase large subunit-like protein